ncbi:amino acid adenylation domain-containing protein, partial [Leptolyngbya sp. FACHB-36]|uniref:non-ribosomal peptide synthetase n=1 Tax=Leptolyngbya sp. FACHB-36 TaxID=2692808 RepID=UPI001681B0AC
SLPDLPIQYADFAHWQREWLQGHVLETQRAYWRSQLQDLPVLDLPTDYPRSPSQTYRGAVQAIVLSQPLTAALETLSQQEGVSLFMVLLAAFQTLLYRYTGQTDIVVGSPIANRNRSKLENLIGFFVNSLVLRTNLDGNPTFRVLLHRVREVTLSAYAHQDLPFEKLVQDLHPQRDLSRHPLFQVAIALQNTPIEALKLPELTLERFDVEIGTTRLDLEFHLWQSPTGLRGQITYSTDLFEPATIARFLGHFQTLLDGIIQQPDSPLSDLPILTAPERQQLLIEWNQPAQTSDLRLQTFPCLHHLFEHQANQTPEAIALVFETVQLTYAELNARSNQLADYLQQLGVGPEVLVGVCLEPSPNVIAAILAVWKAGGAYVPLDPAYPQERLTFMLEDTQLSILITQADGTIATAGLQTVCLDRDWHAIAQHSPANPKRTAAADNLAYVIYTSGSTGQPKGVLIEHRGLANLAQAQDVFRLKPSDRVLQFASLSFDASIFEIAMAIQAGAALYLAQKDARMGAALDAFLRNNAITAVTLPPTVLRSLTENLPALHTIISAGESCSSEIVDRWLAPNRRVFNAYGPTEATVWSTIALLQTRDTQPTIGRAIPNTHIYILDAHRQPVPIGVPGELYIGGIGVARGYLNRPDLTAERFITVECSSLNSELDDADSHSKFKIQHSKLYKTGDRARYRPDGTIEFLGRTDEQIKLRGYRVELGEIEAALVQHPAVREAAIVLSAENPHLVAYVVFHSNHSSTTQELRGYLQAKLPAYLIPSAVVVLESLPLTPNGKVDRTALRRQNPRSTTEWVAPQTPTEKKLAELWTQLLNVESVGVTDHFFELGGDSLLAVRLIDRIAQQFQQSLPVSTLFLAPTIAQLATLLDQTAACSTPAASSWSPLVPLKAKGATRPFFCIHPIFGTVFPYWELAQQLSEDQPFYALQPIGLDAKQQPLTRIEDMAAQYIQAVQTIQPRGPYLLGGWSFGGLVAFEMAQQLQQAGESVALLAIIDTLAPIPANQPSLVDALKFLLTTAVRSSLPFLLDYGSLLAAPRRSRPSWYSRLQWSAIAALMPEDTRLRMLDEVT